MPRPRRVSNLAPCRHRTADLRPLAGPVPGGFGLDGHAPILPGVSQNRLAAPLRAVLSSPGPRRRRRTRETPEARPGSSGTSSSGATGRLVSDARGPRPETQPWPTLPIIRPVTGRIPSTNGRQTGLASRPRRAPGIALASQLRDVAARHAAGGRRRTALPDRRPERVRQGLARVPLPIADQPDARAHRRIQRPGRVRHRADAGLTQRPGPRGGRPNPESRSPPAAGPGRADQGRWRGRDDLHQPALHLCQLHRRVGEPARPRRQPVRRGTARATPTTRSSCTAGWASARPT